jgi:hypothetical protein
MILFIENISEWNRLPDGLELSARQAGTEHDLSRKNTFLSVYPRFSNFISW